MAINPFDAYPTQTVPPSGAYPYGAARDVVVPGDNLGTPYDAHVLNDIFGFFQAMLAAANVSPSGVPDAVGASQYLESIVKIAAAVTGGEITVSTESPSGVPTDGDQWLMIGEVDPIIPAQQGEGGGGDLPPEGGP